MKLKRRTDLTWPVMRWRECWGVLRKIVFCMTTWHKFPPNLKSTRVASRDATGLVRSWWWSHSSFFSFEGITPRSSFLASLIALIPWLKPSPLGLRTLERHPIKALTLRDEGSGNWIECGCWFYWSALTNKSIVSFLKARQLSLTLPLCSLPHAHPSSTFSLYTLAILHFNFINPRVNFTSHCKRFPPPPYRCNCWHHSIHVELKSNQFMHVSLVQSMGCHENRLLLFLHQ